MIAPQQAHALALALPEVIERDHHGFPSYRVNGRIFATFPDEEHVHVMLAEEDIRAAVRRHPRACSEMWWGKKLSAVRVALANIDEQAVRDLLFDAWERHQD